MEPSTSPNFDRIFDPEGNLILRVGGAGGYYSNQHAYYRVCSATLNRASPVFRTRIRSAHYDDWIIFLDLAEDYKSGLEVMLAILHGDFDSLPTKPSISLLYKVISTAEKYQISHMIRPWAKDWFLAAVRKRTCNVEEWFQKIYLARKFGSENLFLAEAVALFMQSTLNKNGLLVHRFPGADRSVRLQDFDFYAPGLTGLFIPTWKPLMSRSSVRPRLTLIPSASRNRRYSPSAPRQPSRFVQSSPRVARLNHERRPMPR
ncbi:hypothetical protein QBC44DRAFT_299085 [Cladorrhinum sp. PSN332]|nr:hypothetical protein QBC44DRAFT_299085 [Cladorrhinum sp. PSN332]